MVSFRRRQMLAAAFVPGGAGDGIEIPTVYQRVEYVDTNGSQYINTGVNTSPDFSAELDLLFLQTPAATTWAMSASNSYGHAWGQYDGVFAIKSYAGSFTQSSASVRSKVEYYVDGGSAYIKIGSDSCSFYYADGTNEWVLFGKNGWGNGGSVRLWECKFYESGVLVRHFIPCYRKSDNKPGMWDMVGWKFYENAGSGADFTVGPDVIQPATKYIVFEDRAVEAICVANWSSDGIGLTLQDAAAVTSLNQKFRENTQIISFDELQYFTGVTTLGEDLFNCSNLARLTLPPGLISFSAYALFGCSSLTELTLPDSVTTINSAAFAGTGISRLVSLPTTPPDALGYFGFYASEIYVPYSADHSILNAYKTAANWSDLASVIFELNPDGTIPS